MNVLFSLISISQFSLFDSADEWYVNSLFHLCSIIRSRKSHFLEKSTPLCIIDYKNDGRSSNLQVSYKTNSVGKQRNERG